MAAYTTSAGKASSRKSTKAKCSFCHQDDGHKVTGCQVKKRFGIHLYLNQIASLTNRLIIGHGIKDLPDRVVTTEKPVGDEKAERVVSSVAPSSALPEPPRGVKKCSIDLATGLDNPDVREKVVKVTLPIMVELQTQPIRSVKGPFTAETVEEAFQANKSGVSGEKVVIEWAK
jgi:hypothetical protein